MKAVRGVPKFCRGLQLRELHSNFNHGHGHQRRVMRFEELRAFH